MKIRLFRHWLTVVGLSVVAVSGLPQAAVYAADPPPPKFFSEDFLDKMRRLEERISDAFRDSLEDEPGNPGAAFNASVDVREQTDRYTVRLALPEAELDRINVSMSGTTLRIGGAGGYEQSVVLRDAIPGAPPEIERKRGTMVITVRKRSSAISAFPSMPPPQEPLIAPDKWDEAFNRVENIAREMDRVFGNFFKDIPIFGNDPNNFASPGLDSNLDLTDEGTSYVIRASFPGRDLSNVNVTVEGLTLTVEAKAEPRNRPDGRHGIGDSMSLSNYSQVLTLPGPVKAHEMKIERKEGMLIVTLPKA